LIGKRCKYFNMFACYNINCYLTFRTERGLHHICFAMLVVNNTWVTTECVVLMVLLLTMKKEEDKHHCCAGVHHMV
jgi:hypothetical protein